MSLMVSFGMPPPPPRPRPRPAPARDPPPPSRVEAVGQTRSQLFRQQPGWGEGGAHRRALVRAPSSHLVHF